MKIGDWVTAQFTDREYKEVDEEVCDEVGNLWKICGFSSPFDALDEIITDESWVNVRAFSNLSYQHQFRYYQLVPFVEAPNEDR